MFANSAEEHTPKNSDARGLLLFVAVIVATDRINNNNNNRLR
jgi:hypothetical protein